MIELDLPYAQKRSEAVDTLVFHCLAFEPAEALKSFEQAKVSAHYMIDLNGRIYRLVSEDLCAWHAGQSFWRGREGLNQHSVGIELCSPSLGQEAYNPRQIKALISLSHALIRRYHIRPENIVGHSDIAPTRKPDPGKAFPWRYLAKNGIGLWYKLPQAPKTAQAVTPSADLPKEAEMLAAIGYDTHNLQAARQAFARRFMPDCIPTVSDIYALLERPYSENFSMPAAYFSDTLVAVWKRYSQALR
jgi:N-acetyl-anhydromuramyl-L-alanine amidase AmpD